MKPLHSEFLITATLGEFMFMECVRGAGSGAEGIIRKIEARHLEPETARRLLRELIEMYPLDALAQS